MRESLKGADRQGAILIDRIGRKVIRKAQIKLKIYALAIHAPNRHIGNGYF
jgi:hypothetical protein